MSVEMDRREFLEIGAGLLIGFAMPQFTGVRVEDAPYPTLYGPFPAMQIQPPDGKPYAYIQIAKDENVTLLFTRAEMGQGIMTSCSQILAEELDCDWKNVHVRFAPVDTNLYGYQGTVGSLSIRTMWSPLRKAGAAAREMLIEAAAQQWAVNRAQCRSENGFVIDSSTRKRASYGSLAEAAAKLSVPASAPLKDAKDYRIVGKPLNRVDTRAKVMANAEFGMDMQLAGMLYAAVARCPVFGGKVASFDASKAKAMPGVKEVLQIATGVAVLAEDSWTALQACRALDVKWDEGAGASLTTAGISEMFAARAKQEGAEARNDGDVRSALAKAAKTLDAIYEVPFLAHATMEPMNCTAHVRADSCDVWAPTQCMTDSRNMTAAMLNLPAEKINFHVTYMGGGFGRRGNYELDFVGEAVEISKQVGNPVKVVWSREDDMQHDFYRPAAYAEFTGALDSDGWPLALQVHLACPAFPPGRPGGVSNTAVAGIRDLHYEIPNFRIDYHAADTTVPVAFWRAPGACQNTFFAESFLDEMAAAGKKDPVEVRRRLLANTPRLLGVLNLAAEKASWGKPLASGRFQGVALGSNVGSFNAQIAEVSVTNGKLRVHRVVCAFDCGQVINPLILRQQIAGGIAFGLAAALKGAITIDKGRVQQANFNTYDVLRIDEMPVVESYIVPSTETPGGAGEACVPAIAPAVTNAIFAATGKRIRKLPLKDTPLA
jgi:isoquinoline 1-oxidoreductase beta subunit